MRNRLLFAAVSLLILLGACQSQPEYCTVKGSIKGVKDGKELQLTDAFDHYKVIETARVKDGVFEFHPHISAPTHVYLFTKDGMQLKDFFLEPGTIIANVDATDEEDYATHATGTPSNDLLFKIHELYNRGETDASNALRDEALNADETGILALYYSDGRGITRRRQRQLFRNRLNAVPHHPTRLLQSMSCCQHNLLMVGRSCFQA